MTVPLLPSNAHLQDASLRPFLAPNFSSIDYLNNNLPAPNKSQSLSALASQTQSHISTLNAQTSRLSATLTSLTDDILRTSSRLAYEVELLRGEAVSLAETLSPNGDLQESISKFVPAGLEHPEPVLKDAASPPKPSDPPADENSSTNHPSEPAALPHLRTLLHVREQLQATISRFNIALSFTLPPSLLSTTASSFISVAAPNTDPDAEAKGQASLARLKEEVTDLLQAGELESAKARVAELRDVCVIWKGTSEERARGKWVDGLDGLIEEDIQRRQEVERGKAGMTATNGPRREQSTPKPVPDATSNSSSSGPGFLRRLRDEIYLE